MRQITVMHGPERRRRWNDEERLRILAEAFAPGACVADVARLHDISTARIYTWRAKLRQQIAVPQFAEAVVGAGEPCSPVMSAPVNHDVAKAINYMLRRWNAFTRFLDDGRVCLSNNAAERSLRCVPLGRKSWLFCGSDRGGQRAAIAYSLIQTCRLNEVDPQAWLADVLARIADHPISRLDELLPWNWRTTQLKLPA